ncbi:HD domain-containing protein [Membranihabitans maritimus]|uniref:HD domain-containing protein n=1 Tax=Membranihabitans maritimus TaxID=2904244 RepID=UPI001F1E7691|nr:HD domain-containing protein [Membranihabitans maritimus]
MNKKKIINDPIYGFINIPFELLFDLIEHPWFQRLRRIYQVGMTNLIYPGAHHTRFHHALGAMHLMWESINQLRNKGVEISEEEARGACAAILLHDIGHGPFSHALEGLMIPSSHEEISLRIIKVLNKEFNGALTVAIDIFTGKHPKKFLHQLVSSELDVDRLDYLNRDSFYTGVVEGKIGTNRIIKMLNVDDNELVIEEKGMYSVEKFLMARKIMYWQVYMHKTVLAAEKMLISAVSRLKYLVNNRVEDFPGSKSFLTLLTEPGKENILDDFISTDDIDVLYTIKQHHKFKDSLFSYLSKGLLDRRLFRTQLSNEPFTKEYEEKIVYRIENAMSLEPNVARQLIFSGAETTKFYSEKPRQIQFLMKDGSVRPFEEISELGVTNSKTTKYYLVYPKV